MGGINLRRKERYSHSQWSLPTDHGGDLKFLQLLPTMEALTFQPKKIATIAKNDI